MLHMMDRPSHSRWGQLCWMATCGLYCVEYCVKYVYNVHVADDGSSQSQSVGPVVLDGHLPSSTMLQHLTGYLALPSNALHFPGQGLLSMSAAPSALVQVLFPFHLYPSISRCYSHPFCTPLFSCLLFPFSPLHTFFCSLSYSACLPCHPSPPEAPPPDKCTHHWTFSDEVCSSVTLHGMVAASTIKLRSSHCECPPLGMSNARAGETQAASAQLFWSGQPRFYLPVGSNCTSDFILQSWLAPCSDITAPACIACPLSRWVGQLEVHNHILTHIQSSDEGISSL